jgi:alkylated DNA repair dioxygenase AlkB
MASSPPVQPDLFGLPAGLPAGLPEGLSYEPEFLTPEEEASLIALISTLPFEAARYKSYTARRRVVSYGGSYDFDANRLQPAQALSPALQPLRERVATWMGLAPEALVHTLVAEYTPGTPLGWHRDVPDFGEIAGVSLGSEAVMRFRPFPPLAPKKTDVLRLALQPRSIYRMRGAARWAWQHSVAPTVQLRWSITFRTARSG